MSNPSNVEVADKIEEVSAKIKKSEYILDSLIDDLRHERIVLATENGTERSGIDFALEVRDAQHDMDDVRVLLHDIWQGFAPSEPEEEEEEEAEPPEPTASRKNLPNRKRKAGVRGAYMSPHVEPNRKAIQSYKEREELTWGEFADRVNKYLEFPYSASALSNIVTTGTRPSRPVMTAIAKTLGMDPLALVGSSDPEQEVTREDIEPKAGVVA